MHIAATGLDRWVECVHRNHRSRDDHDEGTRNQIVEDLATGARDRVPTDPRLFGTEYTLGEDQVDDVDQQNTGIDKNVCSDSNADVMLAVGPDDAQDECCDPSHTKSKHHPRQDEFMVSSVVLLQDRHVDCRKADVKCHEDCANRRVGNIAGKAP